MDEEEMKFSVRSRHIEEGTNNPNGLTRGPLPTRKWNNSLRGSGDVHRAWLQINREALQVIEGYCIGMAIVGN